MTRPLTTRRCEQMMDSPMKNAARCGRLVENRIVESASTLFTAFRFSSLVDCRNSLTIDVDDAHSIEPSLLAQPHSLGCGPQSPHAAKPVCAHSPSLSTGAVRCQSHARWNDITYENQTRDLKRRDGQRTASLNYCGMMLDSMHSRCAW